MIEPASIGFDDDGAQVPAVPFQYPADEPPADDGRRDRLEVITRVLDLLTDRAANPRQVGARCLLLAYMIGAPSAPRSQRELAKIIGVTESAVSHNLKSVREKLCRLSGD